MTEEPAASLNVRGGPNSGMTIPMSSGALIMGRGPDNDLDVDDETVSRRHAVVSISPSGYVLRDLGSGNGTYVNRDEIGQEGHVLRHGDRIRLAGSDATFTFRQKAMGTVRMHMEEPPIQPEHPEELGDGESKLMELLESKKGEAVSREDIAKHVWPETDLEEVLSNQLIDKAVLRVRAHLHDDPRKPRKLITAGEFGYLLVVQHPSIEGF